MPSLPQFILGWAVLVSASPTPAACPNDDEAVARWKGRAVSPDDLGEAFGAAFPLALAPFADWATEHGYTAHVEDEGRVVLYLPRESRTASKQMKLAERTCDAVDTLYACADGAPSAEPWSEAPPIVVNARDEEEYASLLDRAAEIEPYLASWVPGGKKLTGFTLTKPLLSGWASKAAGRVEWNPENELVHRLTHLLTLRRFGEEPYWLLCGLSWHVEIELCRDVYCFPYRQEFVYATEHTAWPKSLARRFKRDPAPFLDELVAWQRGTFDAERGKVAWGFARFLAESPGAADAVLSDLAQLRREEGVRRFEDGTWEVIVGWEPSAEQQRAIFTRHLGDDFEERAIQSFKGRGSRRR